MKRHRQRKVDVDFFKIGIEYEGSRMEIREVRTNDSQDSSRFNQSQIPGLAAVSQSEDIGIAKKLLKCTFPHVT